MGRRSGTETLVAIYQAFLEQATWRQPELAARVGVGVPALRRCLDELRLCGFPADRDEESQRDVFWSVPKSWFPGGVVFPSDELPELLRLLGHLPRGQARDSWITRVLRSAPTARPVEDVTRALVPPVHSDSEDVYERVVEQAALARVAIHFQYFTTSRLAIQWRHASVQRVLVGPPSRFVAVCHRGGGLKWFRIDGILAGRIDEAEPFRRAEDADVVAFLRDSLDGFHDGARPVECVFFVREPEATWVERNLPGPFAHETVSGGRRFRSTTAGVLRLARFVVGLGAAARAETEALARIVRELADGALGKSAENEAAVDGKSTRPG